MKKIIFTLFGLASIFLLNAQTSTPAIKQDVLMVKETSHDFGKIPQGRPATYVFEIVNTGTVPLKLDNVQASCGCTTPQWSNEPIAPGTVSKINVGYNAYADGPFEKTITIQYNQGQTKLLVIKGNVYKAPPSSAPENASVKLLKQISQ
jgi:archaellum component FlaG (FlaF/FlaG flagellin family)